MNFLLYGLAGVLGGILGGMGMGGGTVLIPILTIFFRVGQHTAQAINLIAFVPMAVIALIIHIKNKRVNFRDAFPIIIFGVLTCILGCYIARNLSGNLLKRCFGGFLILLSVFSIYNTIRKSPKND